MNPLRIKRPIKVEIYYPAEYTGLKVSVKITENTKFPILVFAHGFVMTWKDYMNIVDVVVPQGYIIAFPKKERGIFP